MPREGDGNKRTTSEQQLSWFQHLGWLTRLLENNKFRKRMLYCWQGQRRVCRNSYFLDGENKRIEWRLLIGRHLQYEQIWPFFWRSLYKRLVEKRKQAKGGKKSKQGITVFLLMQLGKRSISPLSSGRVISHAILRNCRIHNAQLMFTIFGIPSLGLHLK